MEKTLETHIMIVEKGIVESTHQGHPRVRIIRSSASFLLYFLPAMGFILGACLGGNWASSNGINAIVPSAGLSFLVMGTAFLLARKVSKRSEASKRFMSRMLRIFPPIEP